MRWHVRFPAVTRTHWYRYRWQLGLSVKEVFQIQIHKLRGIPSTKLPISITVFVSYVVPALAFYILAAVLVITPQTRVFRIALWPVVTLLALRALSVDLSQGNPEWKYLNIDYVHAMMSIAIHTLSWTLAERPLVRHLRPANTGSSPSIITDALDLVTNLRGYGWEWSRGLYVPHETRPTNRIVFGSHALLSSIAYCAICWALQLIIQTLTTGVASSHFGSSIFDESLPFFVRYLRSSTIATLGAFIAYYSLQMTYNICTALGVLLFGQDPAQWPPGFDSPWRATSINDFWGRRWHQWFRQTFLISSHPFSLVLGRAGRIVGAFLASGFLHYIMMTSLDSQTEMWRMVVPFGMMAPGIFAERAFYRLTGQRVGGVAGWVWTMAWLILWGNVMVDEFARAGMFVCTTIGGQSSVLALIENLAINFDAWLHTL